MQQLLVVNVQLRSLRPLRRTRPLAAFWPSGLGLAGFQNARPDIGTRFLSLENGDLVTQLPIGLLELPDAIQKFTDNPKQRLDQRRPFLGPNSGKLHLHASQYRKSIRDQLRQFSEFLRRYQSWIQDVIGIRLAQNGRYTFGPAS